MSSSSGSSRAARRLASVVGHLSCGSAADSVTVAFESKRRDFSCIRVSRDGRVGIVTLYRPKALNALNDQLMKEVVQALQDFDADHSIGAVVLTGHGRAFAAGADIKEMQNADYFRMSTVDKIKPWEGVSGCKLPIIAAVNGFALGGGCEIAMMCDIIIASEKARFGQPEIKIGTIPGAGGTQRLARSVGKSRTMEMVLTGDMITPQEALTANLVSRVVPHEQLMAEAVKTAAKIASLSRPIVIQAKRAVNAAYETTLDQGVKTERVIFQTTFALKDRKEGMDAFAAKRKPKWQHE